VKTDPETGQIYDMDACLDEAEKYLGRWAKKQVEAHESSARQKSQTAAETSVRAAHGAISKAKEDTLGAPEWLERQSEADRLDVEARYLHHKMDIWLKRFEAARSEFSAGRRVE